MGRDHWVDQDVDGKKILEWTLTKWGTRVTNGGIWLRDGNSGGIWYLRQWAFEFLTPNNNNNNFDVEDAPRSGRPVEAGEDTIKALIDANRQITTREIAERLNLSNSTVHDHLKRLGLISKLDIWVPHVLSERNLCRRIDVCDLLLKRQENDPFLKLIITGDEKWVVYNNVKRKRSWSKKDEPTQSTSKADIHQKKVMLSVWWDFKGIIFFSFYRTTQRSILKCTVISWTNWMIHLNRKGQNWSIEKV